ncbi:MAG TPA: EAL domain-containing protein [Aestuariivirgaceae bacterium]|nr:EAL domain-containing protein [Aestuariivirgaceae bacterium]
MTAATLQGEERKARADAGDGQLRRQLAHASAELDRVRRMSAAASKSARIGSWELELPSRDLVWSSELYRIHDLDPGSPVSLELALGVYPFEHRSALERALEQAIETGRPFDLELPLVSLHGEVRWVRLTGEAESGEAESGEAESGGAGPMRLLGAMQDITEQRRRERMLQRLARHDDLTGLPNRKLFRENLELALKSADAKSTNMALMLIDVDDFKTTNDTFGHDNGDRLLQEFARRLKLCFRIEDTIARIGGDEFAVVLPDSPDAEGLETIAKRIRVEMAGGFEADGEQVEMSASVGIAVYPEHAANATELLRQADIALYNSKAAGRGVHCFYSHAMGEQLALRHRTLSAIRGAVVAREIMPFYQPIVRASDYQPVGLEALVRWVRQEDQVVPPALFMAALADPLLSTVIGEVMLTAVAAQIAAWQEDGGTVVPVSVNVASDQIAWPDFAPALLNLLDAYGVAPHMVSVEITEDVILSQDRHALVGALNALSRAGIKIDFDDFGTGYASLTHLKEYPVDRIKLDRSFICQLPHDRESLGIVRAVISLAHELDKEVIAEGVETAEQAELLADMGCDFLQGYLFSKPMPAAAAGEYLRRRPEPIRRRMGRCDVVRLDSRKARAEPGGG